MIEYNEFSIVVLGFSVVFYSKVSYAFLLLYMAQNKENIVSFLKIN